MILGFSHFTLRTRGNLRESEAELEKLGYKVDFKEIELRNPEGKRSLLNDWVERMNISFLRGEHALPVELVDYPGTGAGTFSHFEPVASTGSIAPEWRALAADPDLEACLAEFFGASQCRRTEHPHFGIPFWLIGQSSPGVLGFVQRVSDLARAIKFWSRVPGCTVEPAQAGGRELGLVRFRAPLRSWNLNIALLEDSSLPSGNGSMDSIGTSCLSFITSSAERDGIALRADENYRTTGPFEISINQKKLRLEIFNPLPGLYFELLEAAPR